MRPTKSERREICQAYKLQSWLDDRMQCLCDDPMTKAMGAPVGDFFECWSRQHRSMCAKALRTMKHPTARRIVYEALERYMP